MYIETKEITDKYKARGHLYTMFARNKDLQKGPDLQYISQLLHQCYSIYKAVLEYSGPKYNNDQIVDSFLTNTHILPVKDEEKI